MSKSLQEEAQRLATTLGKTNEIVSAITIINTLQTGFQAAAAKWRERITELETEVATLRKEVQETRAIIAPLEAKHAADLKTLQDLVGEDGKGGSTMMAMIAEWLRMASNAPPTGRNSDGTTKISGQTTTSRVADGASKGSGPGEGTNTRSLMSDSANSTRGTLGPDSATGRNYEGSRGRNSQQGSRPSGPGFD